MSLVLAIAGVCRSLPREKSESSRSLHDMKKNLTSIDQRLALQTITIKNLSVLVSVTGGRDLTRFTGCDNSGTTCNVKTK